MLAGVIVATEPLHGFATLALSINEITGHTSPAVLINAGLAGIGVRAAL